MFQGGGREPICCTQYVSLETCMTNDIPSSAAVGVYCCFTQTFDFCVQQSSILPKNPI